MAYDYSNVLTRRTTISSRHTGPVYSNSYALKGIHISYQPPIPIPDPVVLPVGWKPPQISHTNMNIDLSKERQVLEQANLRRQAIAGEVTSPHTSLRGLPPLSITSTTTTVNNTPLIPYQSSAILTPIPVTTGNSNTATSASNINSTNNDTSNSGNSSGIDKPLGEMSLRDFEGEIDPFESTALQAIDVYSELQSVLQPITTTTTPAVDIPLPPRMSHSSPSQIASSPRVSPSLPTYAPLPPPYTPLSSSTNTASNNSSSSSLYQTVSSTQRNNSNSFGILIDVGRDEEERRHSLTEPATRGPILPSSITYPPPPPSSLAPPTPSSVPPPVAPKPSRINPIPSPSSTHRHHVTGGVAVLPSINPETLFPQQPRPPAYSSEPNSYMSYTPSPPIPAPRRMGYSLPDIRSSLTSEERESLHSIAGMGFPSPRVARALKKFEGDDQKVFDFLLQIGEVEEAGYSGDSAETALLAHEQDIEKSIDYLKQVYQYKEVWPEANIHKAYQEASGSWDETIDILTQGR